jgi:gas vesicle protein
MRLFMTFIAGAAVGVVAAILLAPDKGKNTRAKLTNRLKSISSKDVDFQNRETYNLSEITEQGYEKLDDLRSVH